MKMIGHNLWVKAVCIALAIAGGLIFALGYLVNSPDARQDSTRRSEPRASGELAWVTDSGCRQLDAEPLAARATEAGLHLVQNQ